MIFILSGLFVLVVVAMFVVVYLQRPVTTNNPAAGIATSTTATTTSPYANITRIDAKHFYQNGLHTLVGEVNMPTPCDLLNATATPSVTDPTVVDVAFTVINHATTCEQRITADRFKVTATAPKNATFNATFMGRPVTLNIFPAAPGETPDNFQLFQKG